MRALSITNIGTLLNELNEVKVYRNNPKIYSDGVAVRIFCGVKVKTRKNNLVDIRTPLVGQVKSMVDRIRKQLGLKDSYLEIIDRIHDTELTTKYVIAITSIVWNENELLELIQKYMYAVSIEHTSNHIRIPYKNKINNLVSMILPSNAFFILHIDYNESFKLYVSNTYQMKSDSNCYRLYVCEKNIGSEVDMRPDFIKEMHDINSNEFQFIMKAQLGL